MENQNNFQKNNNSLLKLFKKPWTLPILLATVSVIIFLSWSLSDILSFGSDLTLILIFSIFPCLIVFLGVIGIKKKPFLSGISILSVGLFFLSVSSVSMGGGLNPILVLISLFLIFGGIYAIIRSEKILEVQGKEAPKRYKIIKFSFIIFSLVLFLFIGYVIFIVNFSLDPRSSGRNLHRKSDMRQLVTAQEMYCEENGIYLTNNGVMGVPDIVGYLNAPKDPRTTLYPDYVWLDNTNCDPVGEYVCAYATLESGEKIKWNSPKIYTTYYAASEQGTKEVNFIPGSIGGVYGIDHCNCF